MFRNVEPEISKTDAAKKAISLLEEVGLYFNVTRERIRQIEAKALRRLRHPRRANGLRDYIET